MTRAGYAGSARGACALPLIFATFVLLLAAAETAALDPAEVAPASAPAAPEAVLVARGNHAYPPYEFIDEKGDPAGFGVELMQGVARVMGLRIDIRLGPWHEVRMDLEAGRIDAVTGMFFSAERARRVDFSTPYIVISHAVFVRSDSQIRSIEDIRGHAVIVQRGDIMHDYARERLSGCRLIAVPEQLDALRLLASGEHDCALLPRLQGLYHARNSGLSNVRAVGPPIEPKKCCFAVAKGRENLVVQLNEGLAILRQTGEYERTFEKWFGPREGHSHLRHVIWVAAPLAILFLLALAWSWTLRRQVRARTAAIEGELKARREAEEERDRILALSQDLICVAGMDGFFKYVNPAWEQVLGYSEEELLTRPFLEFIHPDDHSRNDAEVAQLSNGQKTVGFENRYVCRDGSVRHMSWTATPFTAEGLIYCIGRDVTDRKRAEQELASHREHLEEEVEKRTAELKKTVGLMAGREVRMAELKEEARSLKRLLAEDQERAEQRESEGEE